MIPLKDWRPRACFHKQNIQGGGVAGDVGGGLAGGGVRVVGDGDHCRWFVVMRVCVFVYSACVRARELSCTRACAVYGVRYRAHARSYIRTRAPQSLRTMAILLELGLCSRPSMCAHVESLHHPRGLITLHE